MITLLATLLLASSPAKASSMEAHPDDDCADTRHLDLSAPVLSPPRICISPGILTAMLFDHPVTVEIQEEVRFVEVIRGRMGIGFMPPRELLPGEQLRLTAVLIVGETQQSLVFVLVTHPGQGSHQVQVDYTPRSWQSMNDALSQSLLNNKGLSEENTALKARVARLEEQAAQPSGLLGAFVGGQLTKEGIATRDVIITPGEVINGLVASKGVGFRGLSNVAVLLTIKNQTREPWHLWNATLLNSLGESLKATRFQQFEEKAPDEFEVFVEFDCSGFALDHVTLTLSDAGSRALPIPNVVFP